LYETALTYRGDDIPFLFRAGVITTGILCCVDAAGCTASGNNVRLLRLQRAARNGTAGMHFVNSSAEERQLFAWDETTRYMFAAPRVYRRRQAHGRLCRPELHYAGLVEGCA